MGATRDHQIRFLYFTGDPTWGNPSSWTQALWQTHDLKINHAILLIISMLGIPEHSHAPSPLPDTWESPHEIMGRQLFRIIPLTKEGKEETNGRLFPPLCKGRVS